MSLLTHYVINFLLIKDNKVLLERESGGYWKLPGGHIRDSETPIEALNREAKEELGINVKVIFSGLLFNESSKAHSLPSPFEMFCHQVDKDESLGIPHRNIGFVYLVKTNQTPKAKEGQEIKWFSNIELEEENIYLPVKKLTEKGLRVVANM